MRILNTTNDTLEYFFLKKEFIDDTLRISIIDKDDFDIDFESSRNFKTFIKENLADFDTVFKSTRCFI